MGASRSKDAADTRWAPASGRSRRSGEIKIWVLSGVIAALALGLMAMTFPSLPSLGTSVQLVLPVAIMFAAAEVFVVHIQLRRQAHSFSLSELPLVLGLFYLDPIFLVGAQLVGAAAALAFHRRQPALKLAFNLSHFLFEIVVAIVVFRAVAGLPDVTSGIDLVAAFMAAVVATWIALTLIFMAISLSEGSLQLRVFPRTFLLGSITTVTNASIALIAVTLLDARATSVWLLVIPSTTVFLAYRAYSSQRARTERIEFLHESTQMITRTPRLESAIAALLEQARRMFSAELAEISLLPPPNTGPALRTIIGPGDEIVHAECPDPDGDPVLGAGRDCGAILGPTQAGVGERYDGVDVKDLMIAPLVGETRVLGYLIVANRLGDVSTFDHQDLTLFETLANHASVALQNGRLERSLAQVTELKESLKHQAFHDPLTGLANRALFMDRIEHALSGSGRTDVSVAILFIDLDDFKQINDLMGHDVGDALLTEVGARLREHVRPPDTVARLGGDEFAILLEDPKPRDAVNVAARVIESLATPFTIAGKECVVNASVGITFGEGTRDAAELMRSADAAMYRAKAHGKGRYEVFDPTMQAAAVHRVEMTGELTAAVEAKELEIAYQPIVELTTGRCIDVEALMRWPGCSERLSPADFIPLAEESGAIHSMGEWVLWQGCLQLKEWERHVPEARRVGLSVNLSARQLLQPDLIGDLHTILASARMDPHRLMVEVTEAGVGSNRTAAVERLTELKRLGVRLALDDFGTGESSLNGLRHLPLDAVKLDRSLVEQLGKGTEDDAVAAAIITLANTLDIRVVAEGIERPGQRRVLQQLGCRLGQGYLFAAPSDPDAITERLRLTTARHGQRDAQVGLRDRPDEH